MKTIDLRFASKEIKLLKSLIGQTLIQYSADPACSGKNRDHFLNLVALFTPQTACALTNTLTVQDYFGTPEDVAVLRVQPILPSVEIASPFIGGKIENFPVRQTISCIELVNERQQLLENGVLTYDVHLTRGLIFHLADNTELSFEKDIWFSDWIQVRRGTHLLKAFAPASDFSKSWEAGFEGSCSREIFLL